MYAQIRFQNVTLTLEAFIHISLAPIRCVVFLTFQRVNLTVQRGNLTLVVFTPFHAQMVFHAHRCQTTHVPVELVQMHV